jgi:hypothetical protein
MGLGSRTHHPLTAGPVQELLLAAQPETGQDRAQSLLSYRFKRSPFKELISDLSSLIFCDSKIQLVDVVA